MSKSYLKKYLAAGVTAFVVIALSIIFYFCFDRIVGLRSFVGKIFAALMPVIWGIVIAYLINPIYNLLHRYLYKILAKRSSRKFSHAVSKGASIGLSLLVLVFIVYALVAMIVPQLISSILNIWENAPAYISEIRIWLFHLLENQPELRSEVMNLYNRISSAALSQVDEYLEALDLSADSIRELLSQVSLVITSLSAGLYRIVVALKNLIIGLIVAIYILATKKKMSAQAKKLLYACCRQKVANVVVEQCRYAHKVLSGFISGKLLDSLIIGVLCFLGCSILKIPYALLVSVVVGLTNIIPVFGPFIGAIPSALFILLLSPIKCLWFIIFIIILQQFDGNILGPKILGDSTGLNSFWVIFALLLFGGLFGVVGMILGVPVFAVFYHLVNEGCNALLRRKGLSADTSNYVLLSRINEGQYQKGDDPSYESERRSTPKEAKESATLAWINKLRRRVESEGNPSAEDETMPETQDSKDETKP